MILRFKGYQIELKMGFKSATNIHNVNQSRRYEVDNLLFYSRFVYENIKSIDENLKLLYTEESNNSHLVYSNVRDDEKYFDEILGKVEDCIEKIRFIQDWYWYEVCDEKETSYFFERFKGIYYCLKEDNCLFDKYGCLVDDYGNVNNQNLNKFEKRIVEIVKELNYMEIKLNYWGRYKLLE